MIKLIWENLKLYKINYLYSIIVVLISTACLVIFELKENSLFNITYISFICIPEFLRLDEIFKSGYFRLLVKLPISNNDIYKHKFVVSVSGIVLIMSLIFIINFFIILPHKLFEFLNILSSNILVGIIIHNSTNIFFLPKKLTQPNSNLFAMAAYMILLFSFFWMFGFITSNDKLYLGKDLISIYYLISLALQIIMAFYFGKLYAYILVRTKTYKRNLV